MNSSWESNGIDWDNISKNRTSDVIRELYKATYELWYNAYLLSRLRSQVPLTTPESHSFAQRDEESLYNICVILNRLFSSDPTPRSSGNGSYTGFVAESCFVLDDADIDDTPNILYDNSFFNGVYYASFMGGLNYATISSLEDIYGDLTFIRDNFIGHRVTPQRLKTIYSILTHPKKCMNYTCKPLGDGYTLSSDSIGYSFTNKSIGFEIRSSEFEEGITNVNDAVGYLRGEIGDLEEDFQPPSSFIRAYQGTSSASSSYKESTIQTTDILSNYSLFTGRLGMPQYSLSDQKIDVIHHSFNDYDEFGVYPNNLPYPVNFTRVQDVQVVNSYVIGSFGGVVNVNYLDFIPPLSDGYSDLQSDVTSGSLTSISSHAKIPLIDITTKAWAKYYP